MPTITVRGPLGPAVVYHFAKDAITVGRSGANDLVLHDPELSRLHAEIRREDPDWVLADRESRNGVRLNARRIEGTARLMPGDEIALGQTVLVFEGSPGGPRPVSDPEAVRGTWSARGEGSGDEERVLVGASAAMYATRDVIDRIAAAPMSVLVTGETGTGKELVARLIHRRSSRAAGPFVVVNCPALPGSLIESELFGVEKGAATDVEARPGQFERARGGTLFLDEIGDMDLGAQPKLLRILEERAVRRLGGRQEIRLDVRVLAATNHDLEADVERGAFRRDLFHRLDQMRIRLAPLRDRAEDIPLLVEHFLARPGGPAASIAPDALDLLRRHDFRGNVRELEHYVERARWLARGALLGPEDFPEVLRRTEAGTQGRAPDEPRSDHADLYERIVAGSGSFWELVQAPYLRREISRDEVRRLIERAHREAGGSYREMARLLRLEGEYKKLLDFLGRHKLGVNAG